jgi:rhamnogalacturonyl hydrolase YesR
MTLPRFTFPRTLAFRLRVAGVSVALAATFVACSSASSDPNPSNAAGAGSALAGAASTAAGASGAAAGSGGAGPTAGAAGTPSNEAGTGGSAVGGGGASAGGTSGAAGSAGAAGASNPYAADAVFCSAALDSAAADYKGFLAKYTDPTKIPRSVKGSTVMQVGITDWTSGFNAGVMWLLYEHTKDEAYRSAAEKWTAALYADRLRTDDHDVGFEMMTSYGNGYRITKNADYAAVLKTAGQSLSTRFNAKIGCTKSWNNDMWTFPVIIDNMMNLELLYRATELGGSATLAANAKQHALTTLTNHFRPDFSSFHLVDYNPSTGAVIKKQTVQGIADDSAWARGQTWGLYGFTMSYRESKDERFLAHALGIAEFYTKHADFPADNVPYFDFATAQRQDIPDYRDASAGAIAAGGLLELAQYASPEAAERYRAFAIKALRSLASSAYRASAGSNGNFLLQHSVGHFPAGTEIDVAINYADYYFVEALARCKALAKPVAPTPL